MDGAMFDIGQGLAISRAQAHRGNYREWLRYPSPFFDLGLTYLPDNVYDLFQWCRYYFMTHPLINTVCFKMAEYPITPLDYESPDPAVSGQWKTLFEDGLNIRRFQIECGLDYNAYGNCFISVSFPFRKNLICSACGKEYYIKERQRLRYEFRNLRFHIVDCENCGHTGEAGVHDVYVKSPRDIKLVRWNPENIHVVHNEITGESRYYYTMPLLTQNDIVLGKRNIIEELPDIYVEAVRQGKVILFNPDTLFHFKRPTVAQRDMGYGSPMILPVLKDAYYMQILRKAQEMIGQEYIVPLRILFPQMNAAEGNPFTNVNLLNWAKSLEQEIHFWRQDMNYIPISPIPIGHQIVGGSGRALMLHQEMRILSEEIVVGMGVPTEFVWGGLQYSGTQVSMSMLHKHFEGYRMDMKRMINFVVRRIGNFMDWPICKIEQRRFKMADDMQRTMVLVQLNQMGKVSDETLLEELEVNRAEEIRHRAAEVEDELKVNRRQQIAAAATSGEAGLIQMRYQNKGMAAQQQMAANIQERAMLEMQQAQATGTLPVGPNPSGQTITPPAGQPPAPPVSGEEVAPGMPPQSTVYAENADPQTLMPGASSLSVLHRGARFNLLYLARRAAAEIKKEHKGDPAFAARILTEMQGRNPELHKLVMQLLQSEKGTQENPVSLPRPVLRPPRRASLKG